MNVALLGAPPERPDIDAYPPIQRCLDVATKTGEPVEVPNGRYWLKSGNLMAGSDVTIKGMHHGPWTPMLRPWEKPQGPTFLFYKRDGNAGITFWGNNCGLVNMIAAYPEQLGINAPGVGQSGPRVYPPTVHFKGTGRMQGCTLFNSYRGVVVNCGQVEIHDCKIGGMYRDIEIDNAWDVVSIKDSMFSLYWGTWADPGHPWNNPLFWWVMNNGIGITAMKADGLRISGVLIHGRNTGLLLDENPAIYEGSPSGTVTDLNLDTVRHGVVARAAHPAFGVVFTGLGLGPYWDNPPAGYAIHLSAGATQKPRISVIGGSIRLKWKERFRREAGELYIRDMMSADDEGKPAGVINSRFV